MKKLLVVILALLLVLTFCAGCGGKGKDSAAGGGNSAAAGKEVREGDEDEAQGDDGGEPMDWPAADLPDGFPEYPDGIIDTVDDKDSILLIVIMGTEKETYDGYLETLESEGWEVPTWDTISDETHVTLTKDYWMAMVTFLQLSETGRVSISVQDLGDDLSQYHEWPENLPFDLPQYTDGKIEYVDYSDNSFAASFVGTSESAYEEYIKEIEKAGWEILYDEDSFCMAETKGWSLTVLFDEGDVSISVNPT